jgi:hypothetical protein
MKSATLLLALLALGQSESDRDWLLQPQLVPGLELVYTGTCHEESLVAGPSSRRAYRFENHVLVLSSEAKSWDVAFMTTLSVREPTEPPRYVPASVRLEVARIDAQSRMKAVAPGATLRTPVALPPLIEIGCFVETPVGRVGRNAFWEVGEEDRPPRSWRAQGTETCNGAVCVKLLGQQQSDDWDRPRADHTAWRRGDVVWLSLELGFAVKVERTVERRDPARREPTHRTVTAYNLESRLRYPGRLFEDRKQEVFLARKLGDDINPLLRDPNEAQGRLDQLLRKITHHLETHPATPYRQAVTHLVKRVDSARRGEIVPAEFVEETPQPLGPLRVGQKVPDFLVTDLSDRSSTRLSRLLGRPVLVFYYNPHTEIGVELLNFAKDLAAKRGDQIAVMAMAVTTDADFARQQRETLKLPFPVLDGGAMRIPFAVEATPRFIVLDREGAVRHMVTGWGPQIPDELSEHLP